MTRRQVLLGVLGLGIGLLVASVLSIPFVLAQIRTTQLEGTPTGKRLLESSNRVLDCTDAGTDGKPPGDCYTQNQKQTAALVGQIGAGNILAVVCALQVPDDVPLEPAIKQVSRCVAAQLNQKP